MKNSYNIVLITIDALRPDYLGCYGNSLGASPNIDNLAERSILFENAYSCHFGTDPIHTTLLTGLSPWAHGVLHHGPLVKKEEMEKLSLKRDYFLSNILKAEGYQTYGVDFLGRWHKTGFDHYSNSLESKTEKLLRDSYEKLRVYRWLPYNIFKLLPGSLAAQDPAERIVSHAIKLIEGVGRNRFFLFLHFWDTHAPYAPPNRYVEKFRNVSTPYNKRVDVFLNRISDSKFRRIMELCVYGANHTDEVTHRYLGAINYVDEQIGNLVFFLESKGLLDRTLIVITSDHGEHLGEHDTYFQHHTVFNEILRVALIIAFPDGRNGRSGELVQHVDIVPTIIDSLGLRSELQFDGSTLIPLVEGHNDHAFRKVYFGSRGSEIGLGDREGIIDGRYKYSFSLDKSQKKCPRCGIVHHQQEELYDLREDPKEMKNLIIEKPEKAKELKSLILEHSNSIDEREKIEKIKRRVKELKSLGRI